MSNDEVQTVYDVRWMGNILSTHPTRELAQKHCLILQRSGFLSVYVAPRRSNDE